ncbi:uncharacterized protein LTR77_003281 [Saxophila tyrrhenica]|uniref:Amino acid transporter transmembrane domain-containing protein n=1 Tax=Saxophila tyrrhenica TaxID=1690608 RepID=A0AAV9PGY2_9PEZI|nr:hypothetical protein LTR77_003281 [Saxophila tyrrhenica]
MAEEYKPSIEDARKSADSSPHNHHHPASDEKPSYDEEAANRRASRRASKYEDPFGDESNNEVKYRTMHWWQAAITMIAETISLGILSLPSVLGTIGIVGGLITLIGLGLVATYTGYVIGQFKLAYPHIHNMADAGEVLFRPIGWGGFGREFFGAAQVIFLIFIMGSHILTWIIALNTISDHITCSIVWGVVGTIILFLFTLPRTLKKVSYLSISSFVSIFSAVLITMVAIGIESPDPTVQVSTTVAFPTAFGSVTNIIFAYAGHVAFFSFISELKDPNDYPKALFMLQGWDISMYIVASLVIYRYGGPDVASPALSSTGTTVGKVAYGIALPTIVIAGIINAHVAAKYVYVRMFRGTKHMSQRTWLSLGSWVLITLILWIIAWIIAESIPVFNDLLGLISALFASWFTYGLSGVFWLFLNKGHYFDNWKKGCLTVINVLIFWLGAAICVIGLYASGKAIHDSSASGAGGSWSCANNVGG